MPPPFFKLYSGKWQGCEGDGTDNLIGEGESVIHVVGLES